MEASELVKRFEDARIGDCLLHKAFVMLANASTKSASQFLEIVEGMNTFNNYMCESEALDVVEKMQNADGTVGPKWDSDTLFSKVTELGGEIEHLPKYNKWALYVAMNMISSDHSAFLQKYSNGDADSYALMCYELAVSKLTDKDRPRWIREYFHL